MKSWRWIQVTWLSVIVITPLSYQSISVSVVTLSLSPPLSLHIYLFILKSVKQGHKKQSCRLEWGDFWMHLKVIQISEIQIVTSAMGGGYALGRLLRYEVVCLFLSFDLWSSEDLRSKIAFDPGSFMPKIIQISKVIIKARGLWSQSNLLCYVTLH